MDVFIKKLIHLKFQPVHFILTDESSAHAGHNQAAAKGGTHFRLLIVSKKFEDKTRIERHRMIYDALAEALQKGVHALSITALTPDEWKSQK